VIGEFVDYATGTTEEREQYRRLFEVVRKRQADVVLVWRYDRFARSTHALISALQEFRARGVDFISYQENVDTTTPQGELIFSIMASLAQFESALISDRVKAGMSRARAQGKRTSRPQIDLPLQERIRALHSHKWSVRRIALELNVGVGTVQNYKALKVGKQSVASVSRKFPS